MNTRDTLKANDLDLDLTMYDGVDLTVKFATEIATYSDVWTWIKARITAGNYKGIRVCDYIPFTANGYTIKAQVAGINIYKNTNDTPVLGNHIDFISKDCYPQYIQWNTTDNNNGNSTTANPFLASNMYTVLNTTIYGYLPTALQNQIVTKRFLLESRYSSSGALTASNSWTWSDMGKLWLPTEVEVYGHTAWGTYNGYSIGTSIQYPVFANRNKIKGYGNAGGRCHWWLVTSSGSASTDVCYVGDNGAARVASTSATNFAIPICFRISA